MIVRWVGLSSMDSLGRRVWCDGNSSSSAGRVHVERGRGGITVVDYATTYRLDPRSTPNASAL